MMIKVNRALRNQKGFTLIEIIAVLVILGILAAIAIPKYFSLMNDAKNKAAQGAVAEGISRVNAMSAKYLLSYSTPPTYTNISGSLTSTSGTDAGDFTLAYGATDAGGTAVGITASGTASNVAGATANGTAFIVQ